jgi:hypothetical protein
MKLIYENNYGIYQIPRTLLIDSKGKIAGDNLGGQK